jgi:hypothetical protein
MAIEIPDDIGRALGGLAGDVSRAVLEAVAAEAYRSGTITPAQVQQMLGLRSRWDTESFSQVLLPLARPPNCFTKMLRGRCAGGSPRNRVPAARRFHLRAGSIPPVGAGRWERYLRSSAGCFLSAFICVHLWLTVFVFS